MTVEQYKKFILHSPKNVTATHMAEHLPSVSHDKISRFLNNEVINPSELWDLVSPHLDLQDGGMVILDDSVQDKRYARFIEVVKRQYSGNVHGVVAGIGLVNMVYSSGNDGDYYPIDYRLYAPQEDGKTKNEHFQEMFRDLATKGLKTKHIAFDSWYASWTNLKLIHRSGWYFYTSLKSNRLVGINGKYTKLEEVIWNEKSLKEGLCIRLQKVPFELRLFKLVFPDGHIEWLVTNNFEPSMNVYQMELKNDQRWQIECFHREFKQLTASEKCQARKSKAQRKHLHICYQIWLDLKIVAKKIKTTVYQVKKYLTKDYLVATMNNITIVGY
jgi:hypothetical protein